MHEILTYIFDSIYSYVGICTKYYILVDLSVVKIVCSLICTFTIVFSCDNVVFCDYCYFCCGRTESAWRYSQLMKQLELRKHEVEQLSKDFENKIRAKEVHNI